MNPDLFLFLGGLGFCLLLLTVAFHQIDRHWNKRTQPARPQEHEVGPDALRLLEDLDAHLDEYVAADAELADGFARLRQAIRDEQNGDQP